MRIRKCSVCAKEISCFEKYKKEVFKDQTEKILQRNVKEYVYDEQGNLKRDKEGKAICNILPVYIEKMKIVFTCEECLKNG